MAWVERALVGPGSFLEVVLGTLAESHGGVLVGFLFGAFFF